MRIWGYMDHIWRNLELNLETWFTPIVSAPTKTPGFILFLREEINVQRSMFLTQDCLCNYELWPYSWHYSFIIFSHIQIFSLGNIFADCLSLSSYFTAEKWLLPSVPLPLPLKHFYWTSQVGRPQKFTTIQMGYFAMSYRSKFFIYSNYI